ncbi:MAG: 50S ribosomal protein L25 [Candidatus Omnitrophica bacterium]|nr:50S ribosomal protein L25 [Candidatus Omnitrophota bacterium]MDD5080423.1 50S ribosomal protein L25 [Candidatus Omnitrophota bacterium]MDD5441037.1 50S ribosomal protein L25 [Candidatus Omnitrophota bacterium]
METVSVKVNLKEIVGKSAAKKIRKNGDVPAVVYGKGENIMIILDKDALRVLRDVNFSESAIINIDTGKEADKVFAIIKDVQYDPVSDKIIHIDFMRVSMTEKIHVHVPVVLIGEAKGIKAGGDVEQVLREIEIEVLPTNIPDKVTLDVTDLDAGHSLHVSNIAVPDDVKVLTNKEDTVVTILLHKQEAETPQADENAAAAEPKVIKEKADKKDEKAG